MPLLSRKRQRRLLLEILEDRVNPSPTLIANVSLPQRDSAWDYSNGPFNASAIAADLDGDGQQEVLAPGGDGNLYAYKYNKNTGGMDLEREFFTGSFAAPIKSTPIVANANGTLIVYAANVNGFVFAWNARSGGILPGWPVNVAIDGNNPASVYGALAAGDLDGNGLPVLVAAANAPTTNPGSTAHEVTAFRLDGSVKWRFNNDDTVFSGVAIGDLNNDGHLDVVVGGDSSPSQFYWQGGRVNALSADGRRLWVKRTDQVIWSSPVLADLQGNGRLDVVVGTGFFYPSNDNKVYALDPNGNDLPGWPYSTGPGNINARVGSSPAIADLTGNGQLDVIVADSQGRVHAIQPNGVALWVSKAFVAQPFYASPIVADIDNSGRPSVVLSSGDGDGDGVVLRGLTGANGTIDFNYPNSGQPTRPHYTSAAVGHFKGDATYQMAIIANDLTNSGTLLSPSFLEVFNLGASSLVPPWGQQRQDGTGDAVARSAPFDTNLINILFNNALGRPISAGELNGIWLPAFAHTPSLKGPIQAIVSSGEARTKAITDNYHVFLSRDPEPAGLANWLGFLGVGQSYAALQAIIGSSPESFNNAGGTNLLWVTSLYQHVLGRDPGPGEPNFWANALNAGALNRAQVIIGFVRSQEYINRFINAVYVQYGFGNPGPDVQATITVDLNRGKLEEQIIGDVLTTNGDYPRVQQDATFLRAAYTDMLQRTISAPEIAFWENQILINHLPLSAIASAIAHSGEYNAVIVNSYFQTFLGHLPSPGQQAAFVGFLNGGGSRSQFIQILIGSNEYFALGGSTPAGYLNKVFIDVLGRPPGAADQSFWLNQPGNIQAYLPFGVLFQAPTEYFQHVLTQQYFQLLRRLPSTPPDQSRLIAAGTPFGAQIFVNALAAGASQADIQTVLLGSAEYLNIALNKAFWTGSRWLS